MLRKKPRFKAGTEVTFTGTRKQLDQEQVPVEMIEDILSNPQGKVTMNLGDVVIVDFDAAGDFAISKEQLKENG